jgi:hypothetical protein
MSKTHSKDNNLFGDIASTAIAGQLESRLKELERNIAVAHQFIKLADECYTQVRHEWELLQQDDHPTKTSTQLATRIPLSEPSDEDTFEEIPSFKEKKQHTSHDKGEKSFKTFGSTTNHTPSLGAKPETAKKDDEETALETKAPETPQKESKANRHKKGKHHPSKD